MVGDVKASPLRRFARRDLLAFTAGGLAACAEAATASAPPSSGSTPAAGSAAPESRPARQGPSGAPPQAVDLELAFNNLSVFHRDGERLAVARDGRAVYEVWKRGPLLRYELSLADHPAMGDVQRVSARLRVESTKLADRPGIPDEVRVTFHVVDGAGALREASLWERDIGQLAASDVISDALRAVRAVAALAPTKGTPREIRPEELGSLWPNLPAKAR